MAKVAPRRPLKVDDDELLWVVRRTGTALHVAWTLETSTADWQAGPGFVMCGQGAFLTRPTEKQANELVRCRTCAGMVGVPVGFGVPTCATDEAPGLYLTRDELAMLEAAAPGVGRLARTETGVDLLRRARRGADKHVTTKRLRQLGYLADLPGEGAGEYELTEQGAARLPADKAATP